MKALALLVALAACASPTSSPSLDKVRPPWGPMTGGTTVELLGNHFDPDVNRVFVGGREASVVRTIDEQHLEVVIPPSDLAGDAEILVITPHDNVIATDKFRYSEPPAIDSVSPDRVVLSAPPATVTVRGRGFADEAAGIPTVLVNGQPVADVTVRNDSVITFEAPPGVPLSRASIDLINDRGSTRARGFRYAVSDHPGLLAFDQSSGTFATFYDPVTGEATEIPSISNTSKCIYGVIGDGDGTYWVSDYCIQGGQWGFGRLDLYTQTVVDTIVTNRLYPTIARHRGTLYAIEYSSNRFGRLAPTGDLFEWIGSSTVPCCDYGLASDDTTLWIVARLAGVLSIATIDPDTGTTGTPVPLVPPASVIDTRWYAGTIYAVTNSGMLVTIDPTTGVVTELVYVGTSYGLEVFE